MTNPPSTPWYLAGATPVSGRTRALIALSVAIAATLIWGACYQHSFRSLGYPDAADYAQMGRQLARGQGFTSQQTFPYILGWLDAHDLPTAAPWPNLYRFPLPAVLNAISFRIVGVGDFGATLPCGIFFVATCVILFLLGNRVYGPLAGVVSAAMSAVSHSQIHYSLSGLTESGTAFFIAAIALAYISAADAKPSTRLPAVVLGVLIGIGFLQRYNIVFLAGVAAILLVVGPQRRGVRPVLLAALCAWLCVIPWFVFNFTSYSSPLVYLTTDRNLLTGIIRGGVFTSLTQYDPWRVALDHSDVLLRKLTSGWLRQHWSGMFGREFAWLGPLALVGAVTIRSRQQAGLWLFALGAIAISLTAYSLTVVVARFFVPFAPLLLVIVSGSALTLAARIPRRQRVIASVAAIAVIAASSGDLAQRLQRSTVKVPGGAPAFEAVMRLVPPGTVIASPASWKLSWYCDRPSLRFQGRVGQLQEIDDNFVNVGAIYFDRKRAPGFRRALAKSPLAKAFSVVHLLPRGAVLWLRRSPEPPST